MNNIAKTIVERGIEGMGRYYSLYRAYVVQRVDPLDKGRIKICVPEVNGVLLWALTKTHHGSLGTGFKYFAPRIGDVVWVEFENGDLSKPVWSYYGWSKGEIPIALDDPDVMGIVTPNGSVITFDDSDGHLDVYIKGDAAIHCEKVLNLSSEKEVSINGGNNGGVVNIEELTSKLNDTIKNLNEFILKFNTHTHQGVMSGPSTTPPTSNIYNKTLSTFNKSDYEDTKFNH